jgi:hypothetical protein
MAACACSSFGTYKAAIDFGNGQRADVDFEVVGE